MTPDPVAPVFSTTAADDTAAAIHALPVYTFITLVDVLKYKSPAVSASPSLSVDGSELFAPKYVSSKESADAAAAAALAAAAVFEAAAAVAEVAELVSDVAALVALVAASPALVVAVLAWLVAVVAEAAALVALVAALVALVAASPALVLSLIHI